MREGIYLFVCFGPQVKKKRDSKGSCAEKANGMRRWEIIITLIGNKKKFWQRVINTRRRWKPAQPEALKSLWPEDMHVTSRPKISLPSSVEKKTAITCNGHHHHHRRAVVVFASWKAMLLRIVVNFMAEISLSWLETLTVFGVYCCVFAGLVTYLVYWCCYSSRLCLLVEWKYKCSKIMW